MSSLTEFAFRTQIVARLKHALLIFWVPLVLAALVPVIMTVVASWFETPVPQLRELVPLQPSPAVTPNLYLRSPTDLDIMVDTAPFVAGGADILPKLTVSSDGLYLIPTLGVRDQRYVVKSLPGQDGESCRVMFFADGSLTTTVASKLGQMWGLQIPKSREGKKRAAIFTLTAAHVTGCYFAVTQADLSSASQ